MCGPWIGISVMEENKAGKGYEVFGDGERGCIYKLLGQRSLHQEAVSDYRTPV